MRVPCQRLQTPLARHAASVNHLTRAYTIDQPAGLKPPFPKQVRIMDLGGNTVLDSHPGVDPASLTLSRSTITWTRNGATKAAVIN